MNGFFGIVAYVSDKRIYWTFSMDRIRERTSKSMRYNEVAQTQLHTTMQQSHGAHQKKGLLVRCGSHKTVGRAFYVCKRTLIWP